jgi:hypothetical protein
VQRLDAREDRQAARRVELLLLREGVELGT